MYYGQVDHLADWEDVAPEAIVRRQETLRGFADEADQLLADATPDEHILLETVAFTARAAAHALTWRTEQSMVSPANGLHTSLMNFLGRYSLVTADHGADYLVKLRRLPSLLTQITTELTASADAGNIALARHLTATADAIDRSLAASDDGSDPLASQAAPTELSTTDADAWRAEVRSIVAADVRPALADYASALRALSPRGRSDDHAGICNVEGGLAVYRDLVWSSTTLDISAEEIHQIGLDQIARLEEEYRIIAGPLLGTDRIEEIYARLRDDPDIRYQSGEAIVRDATAALERAAAAAPGWFSSIPESECIANQVSGGALAFYSPPDPPTGKPGRFFFNTSDPTAWSTYQLEAVTFHESIPGHHLQMAGFYESTSLHPAQVKFGITAYLEGWGLYTERLADEMGLYSSELARVGMLAADSMRACRLVVDTGMHALGWSRQAAIDFMFANSSLSLGLVEGEIDRYIGMPGQAVSYMVGRLEIDRIRAEAERRPGFDIAAFHDHLLGHGMVPLPTLGRIVLGS
jgi:uncharacterized protein (DUF885 family)